MNPVNTVLRNVHINENATGDSFGDEYQERYSVMEGERLYTLAENPLFVNPTLGDYRVRDEVDFPDIQFEKIGRY